MDKQSQSPKQSTPTSAPADKKEEKKGQAQPVGNEQENQNYLTKEDLPDATNESTGKMGSGQRQDSN